MSDPDAEYFQPRHAIRALLVDPSENRVLLIRTLVPDTNTLIWLAPGGGMEPGETPLACLYREIHEETGLVVNQASGPVWHRQLKFRLHGKAYDQYEDYYWANTKRFTPDASANPATSERDIFRGFKWWTADEINGATDEIFVPLTFGKHFEALLTQGLPNQSYNVGR